MEIENAQNPNPKVLKKVARNIYPGSTGVKGKLS
jgi:hypothetical protein